MRVQSSRSAFSKVLEARQIQLADLIPGTGFALMCAFYATKRADGCAIEKDGDMLLFQWGIANRGSRDHFELGVTRQFMWGSADEGATRRLSLGFEYAPTNELRSIGSGSGWCQSPEQLEEFVSFVTGTRAYQTLEQVEADRVALDYSGA